MGKKNYAFIDSQNLNLGIRSLGWELDFRKFRLYLKNKYRVENAYLFIGYVAENYRLYESLQKLGYILVFKNVLAINKNNKITYKGNVDAELVLHSMIELNNYSRAVIVSGDGDFYCLLDYLVSNGKLEKLLVPNDRYSSLLKIFNKGNYIQQIGLLRTQLELTKNTKRGIHVRSKP